MKLHYKIVIKKIPVFGVAFKDEEKNILDFLKTLVIHMIKLVLIKMDFRN